MKRINESAITSTVGFILEKKSLQHLQDSYAEALKAIQAIIAPSYYTGTLVILSGCVMTGVGLNPRTMTSGVVFYNGEIYQVPSASFTPTTGQMGIWTLTDVNAGTNESTLTDHSTVHALVDNKFIFAAGSSGSGTFDENSANVVFALKNICQVHDISLSDKSSTSKMAIGSSIYVREYHSVPMFDLSTNRIYIKKTGTYRISSKISMQCLSLTGSPSAGLSLKKNGASYFSGNSKILISAENYISLQEDIDSLISGDYLELWIYISGTITLGFDESSIIIQEV